MTKDDVLFGYRQQLFAEAARTSISAGCRTFGVHRSTYCRWKRQVDRHGLEMPRPREHRRPLPLRSLWAADWIALLVRPGRRNMDRSSLLEFRRPRDFVGLIHDGAAVA
jgi:transposase-like protein